MKPIYFLLPLLALCTGCAFADFANAVGVGPESTPEDAEATIGLLSLAATAFTGPLGGAVVGILGGAGLALKKDKGRRNIVGAIDAALDTMSASQATMVKNRLSEVMDDSTKKLVTKIKKKI